jgi:RimJ/RimL family protein N-acetyltransferase
VAASATLEGADGRKQRRLVIKLSDGIVALRPWSAEDAWFMARANADPDIQRYNGALDRFGFPAPPMSASDAEQVITEFTSSWEAFSTTGTPGAGAAFAIVDAISGDLLGCCGLDDWSDNDVVQFGYWLDPHARGRGRATRAATLLTRWLFELGATRVVLKIVVENDASAAVAQRAGFVYEGTMRSQGLWQGQRCDVMLFAALATEWTPGIPEESPTPPTGS